MASKYDYLVGQRFGTRIVKEVTDNGALRMLCDCGNSSTTTPVKILSGISMTCYRCNIKRSKRKCLDLSKDPLEPHKRWYEESWKGS